MVRDHTKTSNEMKTALPQSGANVTPPTGLDERRQGLIDNLRTAGGNFDKVYVNQQVAAHQEALTLMQGYADHGDTAQLKALAAKAAPIVQGHLDHVKQLNDAQG
ncbi:MAG: DUF4142 domain-containing protein [Caulobacteraceae bacterium]